MRYVQSIDLLGFYLLSQVCMSYPSPTIQYIVVTASVQYAQSGLPQLCQEPYECITRAMYRKTIYSSECGPAAQSNFRV